MKVSRIIILSSVVAAAFILALAGIAIELEREEALEDAQHRLSALNRVLSEQLERSLQAVDLVLDDLSENLDRETNWTDKSVYTQLKSHAVAIPQIRALAVVDTSGRIVNDSAEYPTTPIYVGDRDYFFRQQEAADLGMYINSPHKSRRDNQWTVVLSRRVTGKDGSFKGVVFARLRPQYFQEMYSDNLHLGGSAVSVFRRDGILLLRQPHAEEVTGKNLSHFPLFAELRKAERGIYHAIGGIDGKPRILCYAALRGYPLVLNISQEKEAILSAWQTNSVRIAGLTVFTLLLGFFLTRRLLIAVALQEKAAEEIKRSESRLHFITDNIVDALWSWEAGKGVTFVSPSLEALLQKPAAELIGGPLEMIYEQVHLSAIQEKINEFQNGTQSGCGTKYVEVIFENELVIASGARIWTEDSLRLFFDAECQLMLIQGLLHNVTPRKHMEDQLTAAHNFYLGILTNAPALIWRSDKNGKCDWFNTSWLNFTGRSLNQELGDGWIEGVHDEDREARVNIYRNAFEMQKPFEMEYRLRRHDGAYRWIFDSCLPLHSPDGAFVGYIGYCFDITERKLMEESLQNVVAQLNKAQSLAHLGSWELDLEKDALIWSDEIFHIFEIDQTQFAATYEAFLNAIHPEDRNAVNAAYNDSLVKKSPYQIEHRLLMPDGRIKYVEEHGETYYDPSGKPLRSTGTVQDITESKKLGEALRLHASVFENSLEGIVITDPQERIISTNMAFSNITGYSGEEVLGKTPRMLQSGLQDQSFYREMWRSIRESGHWRGEIWNRRKNGEFYAGILNITAVKNDRDEISHYVAVFGDITDIKNIQRKLETITNFDTLTGLPNRILLADRLQQAMAHAQRHERQLAVCYLDLDGFKPINDQYGHEIGDRLLIEIATQLTHSVRGGDTVARIGGDEFVILINDIEFINEVETLLARILAVISQPCRIDGVEMHVSGSIGVTLYPSNEADNDTLLRHADQAMYQAKKLGRNQYHFFDLDQDSQEQSRLQRLQRIQQGLRQGEMRLYYQPKVNMRDGRIVGVEALIRWQHPELGLVGPLDFLPVAEQSDLIVEIGEWVLHEALGQMAAWLEQGLRLPVSVNIGARHFQRPDFVRRLHEILAKHSHVPPALLELEIIETAALNDIEEVRNIILACHEIGVTFALDDFGTGYSSLTYLKRLPVDTLKIDQSFVRDMLDDQEDLAIVEGVVGLAAVFQRALVAEGVETAEHGILLMRLGCDIAQGYGIARPMPAEAVIGWTGQYLPDSRWNLWSDKYWDRSHLPLMLAQYDHLKWVKRVMESLHDPAIQPAPNELADHHECRFGRWYDREGQEHYGHLAEFQEIDAIHAQVHRIGQDIIRLRDSGNRKAAENLVETLQKLKERILEKLAILQQIVINGHPVKPD